MLLTCCLSIGKTVPLHSFYLRQSFKSFWLNVWTPPTEMPSRSPDTHALRAHPCTLIFRHLWSTQLPESVEPQPFRVSQVGKKAAYIFFVSLHEHVKGYSNATVRKYSNLTHSNNQAMCSYKQYQDLTTCCRVKFIVNSSLLYGLCWSLLLFLCSAIVAEVRVQSLHAAPGARLNTPCRRISVWDRALWVWCSLAGFPVLVNVICRMLACVLKTCLHLKNNFLENNSPLISPLSQTIHSCPGLYIYMYITFPHAFIILAMVFFWEKLLAY